MSVIVLGGSVACSDDSASSPDTTVPSSSAPPSTAPTTDPPTETSEPAATTAAPTTTISPADLAVTYAERGPFPVGVTTLVLPTGNAVEVWYPAVEGTTGTEQYDMRDFTPEAIKALLTADVPAVFEYEAGRDAAPADGPFPIVLFSHGFAGVRVQSTFLTSHLASWGMVVASPDHPSRDLANVLSNTATGDRSESVNDLLGTLDLVLADTTIGPVVDPALVATVGHSAGGFTAYASANDPRVLGYVSLASGLGNPAENPDAPPIPDKPSFFMAGALDGRIEPTATASAFELASEPSLLWVLDGVGHNGFDDFCTLGDGLGIIGVAIASGLGDFIPEDLRLLGEDGCIPPAVPVDTTFPVINHAVTSWLRTLFGIDAEPIGLGPDVADQYVVAVDITVK